MSMIRRAFLPIVIHSPCRARGGIAGTANDYHTPVSGPVPYLEGYLDHKFLLYSAGRSHLAFQR